MSRKVPKEANLVLEQHLKELKLLFISEYQFDTRRKWRFDYLVAKDQLASANVAVEIEGAVWTQGRHTRGSGYTKDLEKYRTAAALGYKVFRFSTQEVLDGTAKKFLGEWA